MIKGACFSVKKAEEWLYYFESILWTGENTDEINTGFSEVEDVSPLYISYYFLEGGLLREFLFLFCSIRCCIRYASMGGWINLGNCYSDNFKKKKVALLVSLNKLRRNQKAIKADTVELI